MNGWRKSSYSFANGNCVQVAPWRKSSHSESGNCVQAAVDPHDHWVMVRDSKDPDGPQLAFSPLEWHRFTNGIRGAWGKPVRIGRLIVQ